MVLAFLFSTLVGLVFGLYPAAVENVGKLSYIAALPDLHARRTAERSEVHYTTRILMVPLTAKVAKNAAAMAKSAARITETEANLSATAAEIAAFE
ncbi:hypothetical protein [Chelativorans salis]|uniref:Uncharacterized protein n=1 Tax=Chelativorans salis TaxID=2978478 RepID=A0ABT2LW89_9HYPH|nr:hypothetical protein [Chelativorans sp. EGI FJ00035]MCT7378676.1 hypothetical protein [Chelativorans sp. EGI FJ00035]